MRVRIGEDGGFVASIFSRAHVNTSSYLFIFLFFIFNMQHWVIQHLQVVVCAFAIHTVEPQCVPTVRDVLVRACNNRNDHCMHFDWLRAERSSEFPPESTNTIQPSPHPTTIQPSPHPNTTQPSPHPTTIQPPPHPTTIHPSITPP